MRYSCYAGGVLAELAGDVSDVLLDVIPLSCLILLYD